MSLSSLVSRAFSAFRPSGHGKESSTVQGVKERIKSGVNGGVERDESLDFSSVFGNIATPMPAAKKPDGARTVRTYVASPKKVDLELSAPAKKPKSLFWNFDIRNLANTVPLVVALALGGTAVLQQKENSDLAKRAEAAEQKYDALNGKTASIARSAESMVASVKTIVKRNSQLERENVELDEALKLKTAELDTVLDSIRSRTGKAPKISKAKPAPIETSKTGSANASVTGKAIEKTAEKRVEKKAAPLKTSAELGTKPVASKLLQGLLARVNANLPEGSWLGFAPSAEGTQVIYTDPSYFRRFTYERPENADKRTEAELQSWANAQFVRSLDCQKLKQEGAPKNQKPAYCNSAK